MLFRQFSYFKFLLQATNQHGVHSPFMYDFVTKGLYTKGNSNIKLVDFTLDHRLSKKEEKILKKTIKYFKPTSIIINLKIKRIYPNSFIIIKDIHQNKPAVKNWLEITQLQEATVTLDLFYFGLIFFRKEQAKEHFKIRV